MKIQRIVNRVSKHFNDASKSTLEEFSGIVSNNVTNKSKKVAESQDILGALTLQALRTQVEVAAQAVGQLSPCLYHAFMLICGEL
jgi:hypothetical protein